MPCSAFVAEIDPDGKLSLPIKVPGAPAGSCPPHSCGCFARDNGSIIREVDEKRKATDQALKNVQDAVVKKKHDELQTRINALQKASAIPG
jgi:hypothetical protein